MNFIGTILLLVCFALHTHALPKSVPPSAGAATTVSAQTLKSLAPFTQFARAAYCKPNTIKNWSCGQACKANADFKPSIAGGDGDAIQFFFAGFSPSLKSVIVSHQGTDPTKLLSDLTDLNFIPRKLDPKLFPGAPAGIKVHDGFADEQAKTASIVLDQVKKQLAANKVNKVTVIGHSLGGAIAELDCMFLRLNLPKTVQISGVTYGTPRVGNKAWATFFDQQVPDFKRVNNHDDLVPTVPGRFVGFSHPSGEIHILKPGQAVACPGPDNGVDKACTDKSVSNILKGSIPDHLGPYEGIFIGGPFCV